MCDFGNGLTFKDVTAQKSLDYTRLEAVRQIEIFVHGNFGDKD